MVVSSRATPSDALHESGALTCSSQFTYFHHQQHSHLPQRARSLSDDTRVQGRALREMPSASRGTGIAPVIRRSSGRLPNLPRERSAMLLRSASAPVLPRDGLQELLVLRHGPAELQRAVVATAQPASSSLIQQTQQKLQLQLKQRQQHPQQPQQFLTNGCSAEITRTAAAASAANVAAPRPPPQRTATQVTPLSWQVIPTSSPTAAGLSLLPVSAGGQAPKPAPPPFCVPSPARAGARATLAACCCTAATAASAGGGGSVTIRQPPSQQLVAGGCSCATANSTAAAAAVSAQHAEPPATMALPAGRALWHCRSLESMVSPKPAQYFRAVREVDVASPCTTFLGGWQQAILQRSI